ncbi:MAG: acyl-CoA dehydrogenase family protein [Polyangiales bacterium]
MDLNLTDEQRSIRDTTRAFAAREIAPRAKDLDKTAAWPTELLSQIAELGLLGLAVPEELGGAGADNVAYALAIEELSAACASVGVIASVNNSLVCDPLLKYATPAQAQKYLVPLARGTHIGCFGLTEPASGSDASQMQTVARREGDHWIIDGSKNFITNGPHAETMVLFASTAKESGDPRASTAFIVTRDMPGYLPQHHDGKLGIRAAHSCTVMFDGLKVPDAQRLGAIGEGYKIALGTLDGGRIGIAAQALGIARAAYEKALAYAHERKAFGEPIARKQAIQFMIADMATELDAARLLIWRAAWMKDQKRGSHRAESAMAKLYASEMAHRVCHKALQVFGGYGYTTEFDVERHYRDARITEIYEGTSEIMRIVIAGAELKRSQ